MATKKPDPAASDAEQDSAIATPGAMPEPIFAADGQGNERPMSGGSFVRQADGTLIRNPEA